METLQTLGIALGLASLAGINLYLTVFVTGLAIQQHWIELAPHSSDLALLGHPAIVTVAGVFYLLEFIADKIPWVDSLWDAIHTFIRPLGAALLAIRVLGPSDPAIEVCGALLCGGAGLLTHSAKAGTRLVVNHSPEPFSNIALSVVEDAAVIGGLALIHRAPLWALGAFALILASILYCAPRLWRAVKVQLWLLWKKAGLPPSNQAEATLSASLPEALSAGAFLAGTVLWSARCVCGSGEGVPKNMFGYLVTTEESPGAVWFIARGSWRTVVRAMDLSRYTVTHEPRFLSENIVFRSSEKAPSFLFLFSRNQRAVAEAVRHSIVTRNATGADVPATPDDTAQKRAEPGPSPA
jgi:hypothetical protein